MRNKGTLRFYLTIFTTALVLAVSALIPAPPLASAETEDLQVEVRPFEMLVITKSGSYELYYGEHLINVMFNEIPFSELGGIMGDWTGAPAPTATYTSISQAQSEHDIELYFFSDASLFSKLSQEDQDALTQACNGGVVVGAYGEGDDLRNAMAMAGSNNDTDSSVDERAKATFFFVGPTGVRSDLMIAISDATTPARFWQKLAPWISTNLEGYTATADNSSSPWESVYEQKGHYWNPATDTSTKLRVYRLDAEGFDKVHDWYRVDIQMQNADNGYLFNTKICAYYTVDNYIKVQLPNSADIEEHMPLGTVGTEGTSFTLGASATFKGITGSVSFSRSYGASRVRVLDNANYHLRSLDWSTKFSGPNYTWFPIITAPANVAITSYTWEPSFIVSVPKGEKLEMTVSYNVRAEEDYWPISFPGIGAVAYKRTIHSSQDEIKVTVKP